MVNEKIVEIAGGKPGLSGAYLRNVYDVDAGIYYALVPSNHAFQEDVEGIHLRGFTGSGQSIAILDTGLLTHHPDLSKRLVESIDFTNTDTEDRNGHGTIVALLATWTSPDASLYNVKVLDDSGLGTKEALIEGIQWAISRKPTVINISAGICVKKWLFWDCKGDCDVCQAANEAVEKGIVVVAAAGNQPNTTYCPGTSGVKGGAVMAVEAFDMETLSHASYSGVGNIGAPAGGYFLRKVEHK